MKPCPSHLCMLFQTETKKETQINKLLSSRFHVNKQQDTSVVNMMMQPSISHIHPDPPPICWPTWTPT